MAFVLNRIIWNMSKLINRKFATNKKTKDFRFVNLFLGILLTSCCMIAQTNDTLRKKTVKEFDFADYNKDGFITRGELNTVINEKFDNNNTSFSSLDVYRLTLYFKNQYLPNELMAELPEEPKVPKDTLIEREDEKPGSLNKYFTIGGELTGLFQSSSRLYKAKYDGPVSLPAKAHDEKLVLFSIPILCTPWKGAEINFTPEFSDGNGVGNGAGVAAYPNALYGFPTSRPYILRAQYHQTFETNTAKKKKLLNYNFTIGQFILQEMFSVNPYASNPKRDFLNFAHTMLNAWDAATTAYGYTYGFASSFVFKKSSLNFAAGTVNKDQGGPKPDWNISKGYSFNLQYAKEFYLSGRPGTIRGLGFLNSAKSGVYKNFEYEYDSLSSTQTAFFSDSLKNYQVKYGFGLDADWAVSDNLGVFARYSWNDGKSESWGYTQCDGSVNAGLFYNFGKLFHRESDGIGISGSYNTISKDHRNFLKHGGTGFMVGDGTLTYAPEIVGEFYITSNVVEHCFITFNYQYMLNPAYNKDRGSVNFLGARFHFEF